MKQVERKNIPAASPSPKFGQGDAAPPEFKNTLNRAAQIASTIGDGQTRETFVQKIQVLIKVSDRRNSDYERWTKMLERELDRTNLSFERLWTCLAAIEREAIQ